MATLLMLSLALYALGCGTGLACERARWTGRGARWAIFGLALGGAALTGAAAVGTLLRGTTAAWTWGGGAPYLRYSLRLDPLAAIFLLALGLTGAAVSIYSLGYGGARRGGGRFGFFFHLLLLTLTLVFTAANILFFLIAWELTAVAAYFLIIHDHGSAEAQAGGRLYFMMSRAGTALLLAGFLLLAAQSGSQQFARLHGTGMAAFVLLFLGFGVKAGMVPLHVWLPAAHPVAPSNVSALLSSIVIKAGIYGMARLCFDFYGGAPVWAGMLVLGVGAASALLGVLYALMEHDLKRLLAYHSVENIGIILLGLGAALLFRTFGHPELAALALAAALLHTLNHAAFKCLLFLGAGSAVEATGTRNMEEMGGLIGRMPATALLFLIGAIAISGLPPLNGFVSEWFTYQALLAGFNLTPSLARLAFPIAGALLALAAALAAACFVKAFGITFLALPRSARAERAVEAPRSMLAGMGLLAAACVGLGLGASWVMPILYPITLRTLGAAAGRALARGIVLKSGAVAAGSVSPLALAGLLLVLGAAPLLLWQALGRRARRSVGPPWGCGQAELTAANEYTATAFSKPLRMIFAALFQPRREIQAEFEVSAYYPTAIHFESEITPAFERYAYRPLREGVLGVAALMRRIQAGSVHAYLAYIFVTLILLLLFGVRA